MIVYCMLAITLLVAITSLALLWPARSFMPGRTTAILSVSMGIFIYLYGTWVFLSVYLKYLFAAILAALLLIYLFKASDQLPKKTNKAAKAASAIFSAFFIALCIMYFTGTNGTPYGVADIAFPFKKGNYLVFQGGNGLPTNAFHYSIRKAVYAMDIVKLNKVGNRAHSIFTRRLTGYNIYNDTVYSPVSGTVTATEESNPDNKPGIVKRGPKNTNYILVETDKYRVLMAHFRPNGGVFVQPGQNVLKGQPIGLVGNSGFSLEPHLHIQVHAITDRALPWYREPQLQIQFDGRQYLLFEKIKAEVASH